MRRFLCVLAATLSCIWLPATLRAEPVPFNDAFPPGADSVCGVPGGLTAIQQLPPVRVIFFDPISNSFAFMACDPDENEGRKTISNQDFLDRHRLALTTQKIRLLILPYNPFDGDLFLEVVDGEGFEFEDVLGGLPPPTGGTMESDRTSDQEPATMEAPEMPEPAGDTGLGLLIKEIQWKEYPTLVEEVTTGLRLLRSSERCIRASLEAVPLLFTRRLVSEPQITFSLERDVTLNEVENEALRRRQLIQDDDLYTPCDPQASDFQADILAFDALVTQQATAIEELKGYTDRMARSAQELPLWPPNGSQSGVQAWRNYLDDVEEFMDEAEDLNARLAAELNDIQQAADQLRAENNRFQSALSSPAMQIQRFNFNPLGHGKSLTFTIRRGAKQPDDGPLVPARTNKLEIKSAPVHAMRFGMGLVASRLKSDGDDGGDGQVLPGLFLHHYWGRRSPLLEPTAFERWMPTLSVGIPVSEAEALSQFFLGLDWELVPGFEINLGGHFGKVSEKLESAVYFGIVVTRDAFNSVFSGGED